MSFPLHPFNRDFSWSNHTGPFETLSNAQVKSFDQEGFFLFKNAFTEDEISRLAEAIDPFEAQTEEFLRTRENGEYFISKADAITFVPHLVNRSPVIKSFAKHKVLASIAKDLLGNNTRLYWDQSVYKKPENPKPFPFHQDNGYTFINPQVYLTCWIPLVDVDENNGCPWVVPGMHRMGTLAHKTTKLGYELFPAHDQQISVPAKAGDIVVFSSLTPHKTGPNLSANTRKAYILQYAPDGIRRIQDEQDKGTLQMDSERQFFVVKNGKLI